MDGKRSPLYKELKNLCYNDTKSLFNIPQEDLKKEDHLPHLIDLYKLYVEATDRVTDRRLAINRYFLAYNSTILGVLLACFTKAWVQQHTRFMLEILQIVGFLFAACAAGILLNLLWLRYNSKFEKLNKVKFDILCEIEELLPISLYTFESKKLPKDVTFSRLERYIPLFLTCLYACLLCVLLYYPYE